MLNNQYLNTTGKVTLDSLLDEPLAFKLYMAQANQASNSLILDGIETMEQTTANQTLLDVKIPST